MKNVIPLGPEKEYVCVSESSKKPGITLKKAFRIVFSDRGILRAGYSKEDEKWFFAIQDVVGLLSESKDPRQYIKKMRGRSKELQEHWDSWSVMRPVGMEPGTRYILRAADWKGMTEIIRYIPSKIARPFQEWLEKEGIAKLEASKNPADLLTAALIQAAELITDEKMPVKVTWEFQSSEDR